jgi:hypothetical protein
VNPRCDLGLESHESLKSDLKIRRCQGVSLLHSLRGRGGCPAAQTCTTLYSFDYSTGAAWPDGGLARASDGLLYGRAYDGEYGSQVSDGGTIFKMTTGGGLTTIEKFCTPNRECPAFYGPMAPPIEATDGHLYGTT